MADYQDYPFTEVCLAVEDLANIGCLCFQKWTCGGCGQRISSSNPNFFTMSGRCEDCGHITNIVKAGCNYAVIAEGQAAEEYLKLVMVKGE